MLNGYSIRKSADEVEINIETFLLATQDNKLYK